MAEVQFVKVGKITPRIQRMELETHRTYDYVVEKWANDSAHNYRPRTWYRYSQCKEIVRKHFGGRPWSDVDRDSLTEFVKTRREEGVTVATIKAELVLVSQVAEYAIEQKWADVNPVRMLSKRLTKYRQPVFRKPPDWCVEAIIDECMGGFQALARFALATGIRLGEGTHMRVDDVDVERGCAVLPDTKNGSTRTIELSPEAVAVVRAQIPYACDGWLFPSARGGPFAEPSTTWQQAVRKAKKASATKGVSFTAMPFHGLRHLYAIRYLSSGGNIYWLQIQLGHGSIKVTERYLQYLTPTEGLQAQFGGGGKGQGLG